MFSIPADSRGSIQLKFNYWDEMFLQTEGFPRDLSGLFWGLLRERGGERGYLRAEGSLPLLGRHPVAGGHRSCE